MHTLELKGAEYQIGKLDTMTQFHLSRRLGPIFAATGLSVGALMDGSKKLDLDDFAPILVPITHIMASMNEADVNYILQHSLAVVRRKQGENAWAPVQASGGALMFEDIDLGVMLRLVIETLKVNLADFLMGLGDEATSQSS